MLFAFWWLERRRKAEHRECREFEFLMLFAVMMVAAYSSFVFGVFFFLRYYYPIYFIGMIFAGMALDDAIRYFQTQRLFVRRAALAATGAYAAGLLFMGYTSGFRTTPVYRFYDAARWIKTHTDSSDTIGVFQSGAIGYLSGRRVINLDGKVNSEAFHALREGRLESYVESAGIDLVMDSQNVIDLFLGPWSDADRKRLESERVFHRRRVRCTRLDRIPCLAAARLQRRRIRRHRLPQRPRPRPLTSPLSPLLISALISAARDSRRGSLGAASTARSGSSRGECPSGNALRTPSLVDARTPRSLQSTSANDMSGEAGPEGASFQILASDVGNRGGRTCRETRSSYGADSVCALREQRLEWYLFERVRGGETEHRERAFHDSQRERRVAAAEVLAVDVNRETARRRRSSPLHRDRARCRAW
jgi:hypothetical protein